MAKRTRKVPQRSRMSPEAAAYLPRPEFPHRPIWTGRGRPAVQGHRRKASVLVEGGTTVDESMLTGESKPVEKGEGDQVIGGSVNGGAVFMSASTVIVSINARLLRVRRAARCGGAQG